MKYTYSKRHDVSKNSYAEIMLDKCNTEKGGPCLREIQILWKDSLSIKIC